MKSFLVCSLSLVLLFAPMGCGKKLDQSSPEKVARSFSNAMSKEDWSTAFKCMTPESQDMMLLPVLLTAAFSGMMEQGDEKQKQAAEELNAILEKHGVDTSNEKNGRGLDNVEDKGALFADFVNWGKENAKDKDKGKESSKEFQYVKFSDFNVDGDRATAKSGDDTVQFKKIDGKWYIDLVATMEKEKIQQSAD